MPVHDKWMSRRARLKHETRRTFTDESVRYYQRRMYGPSHMRRYLSMRNETLQALLGECAPDRRGLRVLEVGCGPGLSLVHLAQGSRDTFVGVDVSAEMLRLARENTVDSASPQFVRGSALKLPFGDGEFDFVYATRFIHMFQDKETVINELRRVTHRSGLVAVEFYRRPYHLLRWITGRHPVALRNFLSHYPTQAEVNTLVGSDARFFPLRFGLEALLQLILSDDRLRRGLAASWSSPLWLAVDEYFAVTTGVGGPARRRQPAGVHPHLEAEEEVTETL